MAKSTAKTGKRRLTLQRQRSGRRFLSFTPSEKQGLFAMFQRGRVEGGGGNRRTKVDQVGPLALNVWDITLVFSTCGCSLAEPFGP